MHVGIANLQWQGKRSRHSRRMHNPQFYVSGKRPMAAHFLNVVGSKQCLSPFPAVVILCMETMMIGKVNQLCDPCSIWPCFITRFITCPYSRTLQSLQRSRENEKRWMVITVPLEYNNCVAYWKWSYSSPKCCLRSSVYIHTVIIIRVWPYKINSHLLTCTLRRSIEMQFLWHVDTRPISPFLFFCYYTFYLCIIIVIFYLMYLIH